MEYDLRDQKLQYAMELLVEEIKELEILVKDLDNIMTQTPTLEDCLIVVSQAVDEIIHDKRDTLHQMSSSIVQ